MTEVLTEAITMVAAGKAVMQLRFLHCEATLTLYTAMNPPKSRKAQLTHQYSVLRQTKSCSQTHIRVWLHLAWHLPSIAFQLKFNFLGLNQTKLHCSCEGCPSIKNSKASWQTAAAWAVLAQLLCWPRSNAQTSGCLWDLHFSHAFLQES